MKRIFDFFASLIGIVLLSPVFLVAALLVKCSSRGPVFFRQKRVGYGGKEFYIHKFRTMYVEGQRSLMEITVKNDSRITPVGVYLRRSKIDEIPQLFDVLLGNMSLVGPRPEVSRYVAYYPDEMRNIIFTVKPGITDLASIKYRDENNLLSASDNPEETYIRRILPKKLRYYKFYVERHSMSLDLYVLCKTIEALFPSKKDDRK